MDEILSHSKKFQLTDILFTTEHHLGLQFGRNDYKDFAKVCFDHFGDKVKNWFTFNEPHIFCSYAYGTGVHAPGRCSPGLKCAIPRGDSLNEPYLVGHHILLAHAEVANLYKNSYKVHRPRLSLVLSLKIIGSGCVLIYILTHQLICRVKMDA